MEPTGSRKGSDSGETEPVSPLKDSLIQPEPPVIEQSPAPATAAGNSDSPLPSNEGETVSAPADREPEPLVKPVQVVKPAPVIGEPPPVVTEESLRGVKGKCPVCGEGPFDRVDLHFRWKHKHRPPGNVEGRKGATAGNRAGSPSKNGLQPEPTQAADFSDIESTATTPRFTIEPAQASLLPNYQQMAEMSFNMTTGLLSQVFGPEWQPRNDEEKGLVVKATADYFKSVQLPDIPPGYVLCFVCLAYAAPRLNQQPTKTKLQQGWLWFKSKFSRKKSNNLLRVVQPSSAEATEGKPNTTDKPSYP